MIRLDVDGFLGNVFQTDSAHAIPKTVPLINGPFGFNVNMTAVAAGKHTVKLVYLDPLTLTATTLATKTFTMVL